MFSLSNAVWTTSWTKTMFCRNSNLRTRNSWTCMFYAHIGYIIQCLEIFMILQILPLSWCLSLSPSLSYTALFSKLFALDSLHFLGFTVCAVPVYTAVVCVWLKVSLWSFLGCWCMCPQLVKDVFGLVYGSCLYRIASCLPFLPILFSTKHSVHPPFLSS